MLHRHAHRGLDFRGVREERSKQGYRSDHCARDCHTLGDRLGGIADGVQVGQDLACFFAQSSHFADAVGVVGDRAVSVHGDVVPGQREHTDAAHGDAVEHVHERFAVVDEHRRQDRQGDEHDRPHRRFVAFGKPAEYRGRRSSLG